MLQMSTLYCCENHVDLLSNIFDMSVLIENMLILG